MMVGLECDSESRFLEAKKFIKDLMVSKEDFSGSSDLY